MKTLIYPNKRLKLKSAEITEFDFQVREFAHQLFDHCVENNGLGMAAPQVDKQIRLVVIRNDLDKIDNKYPRFLLNPKISNPQGKVRHKEGCLSVPKVFAWVERYYSFDLTYHTLEGFGQKIKIENARDDLFGIVIQHEIDHLDGIEFIDKLDRFEKDKVIKALNKLRKKSK